MPPSPSKPKSKARIEAYRGGHRGEALAAWYLRLKLYRIIARRYKTPVGEIDLIATRFGTLAFVEVKARSKAETEAMTLEGINQSRISRAAQYWLARHPRRSETQFRFDVIFLARGRWPRHISNAFDAS
ncbi:putative endonuclease [Devosia sp. YR412]|uniref:YraN family protein n=1 Tax=Devosia sp. YR412 TaxID=1881030 RepID=UPI0008D44AD7|nr:YraN family protein [Devosia sp. YR412]SEQ22114.1 putative endonuclease [Devosia sp. YR412]